MDRQLKERITGAALLVLCAVIVIPWLLDGRVAPDQFEKSISIPPPGGGSSNVRTIMLDADANASAPVTAAPQPVRSELIDPPPIPAPVPVPQPVVQSAPPSVTAEPEQEPSPPAPQAASSEPATPAARKPEPVRVVSAPAPARIDRPDPTAGWAVQVGSFASQANADKLADQLVDLEYKAFVSRKRLNGRVMYRVRVGPRATREEAGELAQRLKTEGQPVSVVEHPG